VAANNGDHIKAVSFAMEALKLLETATAADRSNKEIHLSLAYHYEMLGDLLTFEFGTKTEQRLGEKTIAEEFYRKALVCHDKTIAVFEQLSKEDPTNALYRRNIATKTYNIGWTFERLGYLDEAIKRADTALAIFEELSNADPANVSLKYDQSLALTLKASALEKRGDFTGALNQYRARRAILEKLADIDPSSIDFRASRDGSYLYMGCSLAMMGQLNEAFENFDRALKAIENSSPDYERYYLFAIVRGSRFFNTLSDSSDFRRAPGATLLLKRFLALSRSMANSPDASAAALKEASWLLLNCKPADLRDPEAALRFAGRAVELTRERDPESFNTLALAYEGIRDHEKALLYRKRALALLTELATLLREWE
jgi:tetratricopeptide (TPR) repeat protein